MSENNISVKNLCKSFDGFTLNNISLQVPKGRIVGFIGENGAGKSTLMKILSGVYKKDGGQIFYNGVEEDIKGPILKSLIKFNS